MIGKLLEKHEKECTVKEKDQPRIINLNYRDINTIGYINPRFNFVEELYLNHNLIKSLQGIEQFPFLKVLYIKFNMISNIDEFFQITNKKNLQVLNLLGNPVEKEERCNQEFFLSYFPNLKEFNDKPTSVAQMNGLKTVRLSDMLRLENPVIRDLTNTTHLLNNKTDTISKSQMKQNLPLQQRSATNLKPRAKPNISQDNSYFLNDYDKYEDGSAFENQRTATFAQMQKYSKKELTGSKKQNLDDSVNLQTDRYYRPTYTNQSQNQNMNPFTTEQSIIKPRNTHNGKSFENSCLRFSPNRSSVKYDTARSSARPTNTSYMIEREQTEDSRDQSNILDKHITNIEKDILNLADMFHAKNLKEKTLKSLKITALKERENNIKADQFFQNWKQIQAFYCWTYYVNTNRRKVALVKTISQAKLDPEYDYPQTHRYLPNENKQKSYLHYSDGKDKQQFSYVYQ